MKLKVGSLMLGAILIGLFSRCDKTFRCDCDQEVMGFDTTYTLVSEGQDEQAVCDNFDSSTTDFGITKTVDCEPY